MKCSCQLHAIHVGRYCEPSIVTCAYWVEIPFDIVIPLLEATLTANDEHESGIRVGNDSKVIELIEFWVLRLP